MSPAQERCRLAHRSAAGALPPDRPRQVFDRIVAPADDVPGRLGHLDRGGHPRDHRVVAGQEPVDLLPDRGGADGTASNSAIAAEHPLAAHLGADGRQRGDDRIDATHPAQQRPDLRRRAARRTAAIPSAVPNRSRVSSSCSRASVGTGVFAATNPSKEPSRQAEPPG